MALILVANLCFWPLPTQAGLNDLVRAHQASVQGIHSLSCEVTIEWSAAEPAKQPRVEHGRFRMLGQLQKIIQTSPSGQIVTHWHRDGKCVRDTVYSDKYGLSLNKLESCTTLFNVSTLGGLRVRYPMVQESYTLPELVQMARRVHIEREEGDEIIMVLELPSRGSASRAWTTIKLDRRRGYVITEVLDQTNVAEHGVRVLRLVEFKEFPGGLHFPTVIVQEFRGTKGEIVPIFVMRLRDVRVNEGIAESEFLPAYRAGAVLNDMISGTTYQVDGAGRPASPQVPLQRVVAVLTEKEQARIKAGPREPSQEDDSGVWRVWASLSGAATLALLALWGLQRWRGA